MSFFFFATFSSLVYNTTRVFWGWVHVTMFWVCSFPSSDLWVLCRAGASPAAVGACLHWVNLHMLMTVLDRFPEQAHQREKDTADGWKHVSPKRAGSVFIWFISGCQRDMMECCWGGGVEVRSCDQQSETAAQVSRKCSCCGLLCSPWLAALQTCSF